MITESFILNFIAMIVSFVIFYYLCNKKLHNKFITEVIGYILIMSTALFIFRLIFLILDFIFIK
jgi:uncharacterized membrane protein YjjP (DUF1212 family)